LEVPQQPVSLANHLGTPPPAAPRTPIDLVPRLVEPAFGEHLTRTPRTLHPALYLCISPKPITPLEPNNTIHVALAFHQRPDHPTTEQQATIDTLVTGPLGDVVGRARRFVLEWYALWRTEEGQRRLLAEAQERYERWRTDPAYQALPALQKVQDLMTPTRFARLSQFLRHPHFEATNNGAERMGRAFRHGQAPHFRLRTEGAIEGALRVVMAQTKDRAATPPTPLPRLCMCGRRSRSDGQAVQAA